MVFARGFIVLLMLILGSCGFHLRGALPLAQPLHELFLQTSSPYSQLSHNLREYLKSSGVHLTDKPSEATTVLVILSETMNQHY